LADDLLIESEKNLLLCLFMGMTLLLE